MCAQGRREEAVTGRGAACLVLFIHRLELKAPHNLLLVFRAQYRSWYAALFRSLFEAADDKTKNFQIRDLISEYKTLTLKF